MCWASLSFPSLKEVRCEGWRVRNLSGRIGIFVGLSIGVLYFVGSWIAALRSGSKQSPVPQHLQVSAPSLLQLGVGFVTNFFDTLGIGSFVTTSTIFKLARVIRDELNSWNLDCGTHAADHSPGIFVYRYHSSRPYDSPASHRIFCAWC